MADRSRLRRVMPTAAGIVVASLLSACTPPALLTAGAAAGVWIDAYCKGVSAEIKQGLRNVATKGKPLLCDESSAQ
ncbi:MAG: hypothetical protein NXI18_19525 [Alphaproteobacteria bacterium]|nr:hypothetical protein [Alphaproteobacteria bacterium]